MKCTDYQKIDVLASPSHTKVGTAYCPRDPPGTFKSMTYERQCRHFILATEADKEDRRKKWRLMMNPAPKAKPEQPEEN